MTDTNAKKHPQEHAAGSAEAAPQPPFEGQDQVYPGIEAEMTPKPDFGEESYKGSGKLTDRVAIITGGDSGIGRAVALAFAREGADVVISYLNEHQDAEETARVVRDAGRKALVIGGDIREKSQCQKIVEQTVEEFGQIDILVNNAAFQTTVESFMDLSDEEWHRAMTTNLDAMFYLTQAALKHMKPGGAIINTTSIQASQPSASLIHYSTTKGGIVTFTRALSQEVIEQGIRVNAVAPGPIWTPLIVSTMGEDAYKDFGKDTPLGRAGQPAELAPAYVFLASNDSSYITGETIAVTGGKPM
jgi:NAD(P)-dependent dehydrogenase (short-subunit alcohol dehydrogenase family)